MLRGFLASLFAPQSLTVKMDGYRVQIDHGGARLQVCASGPLTVTADAATITVISGVSGGPKREP